MSISNRLKAVWAHLPANVELIAVSKFHPVNAIKEAYDAGQKLFGESRVQELAQKAPLLPNDVQWHFIGTLQRNKVKQLLPLVHTIHSGDSERLLEEIQYQAQKQNISQVRVLLQVDVTTEATKHGWQPNELREWLNTGNYQKLTNIQFAGVMAMASNTANIGIINAQFAEVKELFQELQTKYFSHTTNFRMLSMGMSQDYEIAIQHGSTHVRIGSAIFGDREY